jgi:hypothetical protein
MTHTERTVSALKAIPKDRLADKIRKTALGVFIAALGITMTAKYAAPWYVAAGGGLLGATIWSGELVVAPIKLLGAALADIWRRTDRRHD